MNNDKEISLSKIEKGGRRRIRYYKEEINLLVFEL